MVHERSGRSCPRGHPARDRADHLRPGRGERHGHPQRRHARHRRGRRSRRDPGAGALPARPDPPNVPGRRAPRGRTRRPRPRATVRDRRLHAWSCATCPGADAGRGGRRDQHEDHDPDRHGPRRPDDPDAALVARPRAGRDAHARGRAAVRRRRHRRASAGPSPEAGRGAGRAGRGRRAGAGLDVRDYAAVEARVDGRRGGDWAASTTSCAPRACSGSGRSRDGPGDLAEIIDVNVTGSLNVARAAHRVPVREPRLDHVVRLELVHPRPARLHRLLREQGRRGQRRPGPRRGVGADGIRVNAVSPERTDTPMRRAAFPEEDRTGMLRRGGRRRGHAAPAAVRPDRPGRRRRAPRRRRPAWSTRSSYPARRRPSLSLRVPLAAVLRVLGCCGSCRPARTGSSWRPRALDDLDGNLLRLHAAIRRLRPDVGRRPPAGAVRLRAGGEAPLPRSGLVRGHVPRADGGPGHRRQRLAARPRRAASAAARRSSRCGTRTGRSSGSGCDTVAPPAEPERTFLHRHYDWVVTSGEQRASRGRGRSGRRSSGWSRWARRGPTCSSTRRPWPRRGRGSWPRTRRWPAGGSCSTRRRSAAAGRQARPARRGSTARACGAAARDACCSSSRPTRTSTRPSSPSTGSTSSSTRRRPQRLACAADVLVTDYSSSIFEWALLRRPLVLRRRRPRGVRARPGPVPRLPTEMVGAQVRDTEAAARRSSTGRGRRGGVGAVHRPAHGRLRRARGRAGRGAVPP